MNSSHILIMIQIQLLATVKHMLILSVWHHTQIACSFVRVCILVSPSLLLAPALNTWSWSVFFSCLIHLSHSLSPSLLRIFNNYMRIYRVRKSKKEKRGKKIMNSIKQSLLDIPMEQCQQDKHSLRFIIFL